MSQSELHDGHLPPGLADVKSLAAVTRNRTATAAPTLGMLFYLVTLGMVGAITVAAFAVASFSLISGNNGIPRRSNLGYQENEFKSIPVDVVSKTERNTPLPATERTLSAFDAAATLPKPRIRSSGPHKSQRREVSRPEAGDELLSSDREIVRTPEVLPTFARPGLAPDGARMPEITSAERSRELPSSAVEGSDTKDPAPASPVPLPAFRDQEREQVFHDFETQHKRNVDPDYHIDLAHEKTPAQPVRKKVPFDRLSGADAGLLRQRVKRECGPIRDPALYRHCVSSFRMHY